MKIKIEADEWCLVYGFSKDGDIEVDVPKEVIDAVSLIASAFDAVQEYLGELSNKAWKKKLGKKSGNCVYVRRNK